MRKILSVLAALVAGFLAGCETVPGRSTATPAVSSPPSGYTCCDLHYENDWIGDANWSSMPMIPAGASIKVLDYGRYRINVEIDGRRMRLGLDYGRQQSLEAWANRIVVRDAVRAGKVTLGMTKDEVIVALGYPPMHATPSLDAPQWKYWHTGFGSFLVVWDNAGRVKDVIADPQTRFGVVHERR